MILILRVEALWKYFQKFISSIIFIGESRKGKLRKYYFPSSIKNHWECAKWRKHGARGGEVVPDTCCSGFYGGSVLMSLITSKEMTSRVLHQKGQNFYQVLVSLGDSMGEI